jgi:predicted negative regulator of RcsB-dependent stress response
MSFSKKTLFSVAVVFLLVLSGLSFGYLVGQSQQAKAERAQGQFQMMTDKVQAQASGALVSKGADAVRRMLIK